MRRPSGSALPVARRSAVWLAAVAVLLTPGCGWFDRSTRPSEQNDVADNSGDGSSDAASVPPVTAMAPRPSPRSLTPARDRIKPGHWATISTSLRANQVDLRGQLTIAPETRLRKGQSPPTAMAGPGDGDADQSDQSTKRAISTNRLQRAAAVSGAGAVAGAASRREVVMPKGQRREFDQRIFPPWAPGGRPSSVVLDGRLDSPGGLVNIGGGLVSCLAPAEYFLVALTTRPERLNGWSTADWRIPPRDPVRFETKVANYTIAIPPIGGVMPIPESSLDWSSTAVVFWDDLPADQLTDRQWQSIVDWLHWGGRLIVNGPAAAASLQNSRLRMDLPIRDDGLIGRSPDVLANLIDQWSVPGDPTASAVRSRILALPEQVTVAGQIDDTPAGSRQPASAVKSTGELIARRPIGRGMIVQSRLDLTGRWQDRWASRDSFFNGVILGRPRRSYVASQNGEPSGGSRGRFAAAVVDPAASTPPPIVTVAGDAMRYDLVYPDHLSTVATGSMNTSLRYFGREGVLRYNVPVSAGESSAAKLNRPMPRSDLYRNDGGSVAAWNDRSDVVQWCITTLQNRSGIATPPAARIAKWLGVYLIVLVPLNFLLFRLLRRPIWSWLAVPIIAAVGAGWIARAARLDIGFSRRIDRLEFVEQHAGYARGHLSAVTSIYNSLSNRYRGGFDHGDSAAVVLAVGSPVGPPGGRDGSVERSVGRAGDDELGWTVTSAGGSVLGGIAVASNQVRMVHSEEMVVAPLWSVDGTTLRHAGDRTWRDAVVVRRQNDGSVQTAVVGTIAPESSVPLRWQPGGPSGLMDLFGGGGEPVDESMGGSTDVVESNMDTLPLRSALCNPASLPPGGCRLVARGQPMGTMQIEPEADSGDVATVLLVHLAYPPEAEPSRDANLLPAKQSR